VIPAPCAKTALRSVQGPAGDWERNRGVVGPPGAADRDRVHTRVR